ncbi:MAG: hypothetical protein ACUVX8_19215 [Candidatus Zipacnadales bacterium]
MLPRREVNDWPELPLPYDGPGQGTAKSGDGLQQFRGEVSSRNTWVARARKTLNLRVSPAGRNPHLMKECTPEIEQAKHIRGQATFRSLRRLFTLFQLYC